jgi:hypothetical protein
MDCSSLVSSSVDLRLDISWKDERRPMRRPCRGAIPCVADPSAVLLLHKPAAEVVCSGCSVHASR